MAAIDRAALLSGYKMSGFGLEMVNESVEQYTQVKRVWLNTGASPED